MGPNTKQGSTKANNQMDLFCIDFTKMNANKNGKKNIFAMMETFSKLSVSSNF